MQLKHLPDDAPSGYEFAMNAPAANAGDVHACNDDHHVDEMVIPAEIDMRELPANTGMRCRPIKDYPIVCHSKGRYFDGKWIMQRMRCIPTDNLLRHRACEQYERIYGEHGRKAANTWLDAVARKYKEFCHG